MRQWGRGRKNGDEGEEEQRTSSHYYTKIARAREMDGERSYPSPTDVGDLDNAT